MLDTEKCNYNRETFLCDKDLKMCINHQKAKFRVPIPSTLNIWVEINLTIKLLQSAGWQGKSNLRWNLKFPTKRNYFSFSEFAQKQKREKDEAIWDVRIYCSICIVVLTLNELELFVGYFIHNPPKHTILDSWICIKTAIYGNAKKHNYKINPKINFTSKGINWQACFCSCQAILICWVSELVVCG